MLTKIIKISFCLLLFLTPLVMTPFNHELFEFNKIILVYLLTIIIIASWLIKMILAKKIIFQRTFWDLPLLIFFTSQLISFLFSIDQHTSFWGYYSRFNGGLLSLTAYLLLYWAYVSNLTHQETKIAGRWLLIGAALTAGYGLAEHFGIDAQYWAQDVQNRVFSTMGQPNWLAAFLVAVIPFTWAFPLITNYELRITNLKKAVFYILNSILYLCLLFTKSRSGLIGFGFAFIVFWGLTFFNCWQKRRQIIKHFLLITFLFLLITFVVGTPWKPNTPGGWEKDTPGVPEFISDSGDIRKVVWRGAIETWRRYPWFGTGPETFAYSYYWFRPREHNDLSEWNFLYNKAHNEYLNYAATTGSIGLASYLLLIAAFIFQRPKPAYLAGFASILVTNFFGFSVVTTNLLFFLLPAMAVISNRQKAISDRQKKLSFGQYAIIAVVLLITSRLLLITFQYWYADTRLAAAEKLILAGQPELASNQLDRAIKLRPQEPLYYDTLAGIKADLNLPQEAIAASDMALKISPFHLSFWKNRTKIFYQLAQTDPQYYQSALESLSQSSLLAPTDAKIKYNLALLYVQDGQIDVAIKLLEETIQLKPNYEDARLALETLKNL